MVALDLFSHLPVVFLSLYSGSSKDFSVLVDMELVADE
jgi:hypothetical protein